ncbi:hypothetical protein SAMN02745135_01679 [Caloranaerobacter azorensis DSM 13643]|uniref:Uncharacterized protein n=1 Tax=Caloranaerobacter azorensis DSM 13643 TaxID=1121264 RepID=A0A1M5V0S5_9FIRM|nr:hypothetical protein SAMN02745135_01679 [Caloranaerobacter azorensis DSM 13643]
MGEVQKESILMQEKLKLEIKKLSEPSDLELQLKIEEKRVELQKLKLELEKLKKSNKKVLINENTSVGDTDENK